MRVLLLDTCGDTGSLALAEGGVVVRERVFSERTASAALVAGIREDLHTAGWALPSLDAVALVNGPGSFTGVRVGLAAAKGLCEVIGVPLVTLSRLAVLHAAAHEPGVMAVLDAGRRELYVRSADDGEERLMRLEELLHIGRQVPVAIAEERLLVSLRELAPKLVPLFARDALPLVTGKLQTGSDDIASVDVNYVRQGSALYAAGAKPASQ